MKDYLAWKDELRKFYDAHKKTNNAQKVTCEKYGISISELSAILNGTRSGFHIWEKAYKAESK